MGTSEDIAAFDVSNEVVRTARAATLGAGVLLSCGICFFVGVLHPGEPLLGWLLDAVQWSCPIAIMSAMMLFMAPWLGYQRSVRFEGTELVVRIAGREKRVPLDDVTNVICRLDTHGNCIAVSLVGRSVTVRLVGFRDLRRLYDLVAHSPSFRGVGRTTTVRAKSWIVLAIPGWILLVFLTLVSMSSVAGIVWWGKLGVLVTLLVTYALLMSAMVVCLWLSHMEQALKLKLTCLALASAVALVGCGLYCIHYVL